MDWTLDWTVHWTLDWILEWISYACAHSWQAECSKISITAIQQPWGAVNEEQDFGKDVGVVPSEVY